MFHIVLFEPEIPPNTGNIIRLCANTGAELHLIQPLGFELGDKKLRRAGLDYSEFASVGVYPNLDKYIEVAQPERIITCSTKGKQNHTEIVFKSGDALLFGPETRGLPDYVLEAIPEEQCVRIPMVENSRSLNLSNAVSIILYEAWRQSGFGGAL